MAFGPTVGDPRENQTPVPGLRIQCPRPLDDGAGAGFGRVQQPPWNVTGRPGFALRSARHAKATDRGKPGWIGLSNVARSVPYESPLLRWSPFRDQAGSCRSP